MLRTDTGEKMKWHQGPSGVNEHMEEQTKPWLSEVRRGTGAMKDTYVWRQVVGASWIQSQWPTWMREWLLRKRGIDKQLYCFTILFSATSIFVITWRLKRSVCLNAIGPIYLYASSGVIIIIHFCSCKGRPHLFSGYCTRQVSRSITCSLCWLCWWQRYTV